MEKNDAPQRTSQGFLISTQNSCADTVPLVLRGSRKGTANGGTANGQLSQSFVAVISK